MPFPFSDMGRYSSEYSRSRDQYSRYSDRGYRNSRSFDCCTPRYTEYDYSPTYGTYVFERRSSRDPSECSCTCCPHSYAGARRASSPRRSSSSSYEAYPYYPSSYDSYHPGKSRGGKVSQKPTHILVENDTDGSLRRRHGSRFTLGIGRGTTTTAILSFLASDRSRYKVVVHWDDNTKETLEPWISTSELQHRASHLEVKKKKRVHFI